MSEAATADLQKQMESLADTHVKTAKQIFNLEFDYSPQSLQLVDHVITKYHGNQAAMDSTITIYGAYIGETVRRALGGAWKEGSERGPELQEIGGSATIFPFGWAYKRFSNGESDLIRHKYEALLNALNRSGEAPPLLKIADEPLDAAVVENEKPASDGQAKSEASDDEIIERSPLVAFLMVAAADGNVDEKEMVKFQQLLISSAAASPLFAKVVANMVPKLGDHAQKLSALGPMGWTLELMRLSTILDEKHPADARAFKEALFRIAKQVAESSGGGWFGFGKKISKEEQTALDLLASFLKLKDA